MNNDQDKYMFQHFENAFNIGWNENGYLSKEQANIDESFISQLKLYCEMPLNRDFNGKHREIVIDGKKYVKGFGEIRILDIKRNIRYASPNIILEDILDGLYNPNADFVETVKYGPKPGEVEYEEFISRYNADCYWGEDENNVKKINETVKFLKKGIIEFRSYMKDSNMLNCVTHDGSLLNYSINDGNSEEALFLIESGIDINIFGGIELLNAIKMNLTEVADRLIELDINMDDTEMNMNPLVSAIRYGNVYLVSRLLNKNPKLLKTYSNEFVKNCTMIDIARKCNNEEMINILHNYI